MARLRKALVSLSLGLALLVAAGLIWREALVEEAARRALAARGLDEARLEVVEVGLSGMVIENVSLGAGRPRARRVRLGYAPGELLSGRLGALRIEGLRYAAPADWSAALAPLNGFAPGDTGSGDGGWLMPPRVEIADAVMTLAAPAGGADSGPALGSIALDGALDLTGERPGAALEIDLDFRQATGAFTLRSEALGEGGTVRISGGGEANLAGMALPGRPGTTATAGRARLTLAGTAPIPAFDAGWDALAGSDALALTGELQIDGATLSAEPGTLSADIAWALHGGDGELRLELPRPARLDLEELSPQRLAALGLGSAEGAPRALSAELAAAGPVLAWTPGPEGGTAVLDGDLALASGGARATARVTATAEHDAAWRLAAPAEVRLELEASDLSLAQAGAAARLRAAEWSAAGSVGADGAVALEGLLALRAGDLGIAALRARSMTVEGEVRLARRPGGWSLGAASELSVVLEEAAVRDTLALAGPLRLTLESLELAPGDGTARLDLRAVARPVSGTLRGGDGDAVAFADAAGRVGLAVTLGERTDGERTDGEVRLADARVTLPGQGLGFAALRGRLPLGDAGEMAAALAGELRALGGEIRFAPVRFTLEGRRDGDSVALSGAAEALGGAVRLPLEGSVDLAAPTGTMTAGPGRVTFRPGGLQPGALSPLLAGLGEVAGAVRVGGGFVLDADGALRTGATLNFDGLALRAGAVEIAGLAGRVLLRRLARPATVGAQELTARSVSAGVPLERPRARFTAEARGQRIILRIHEAEAGLAGGTLALEEARWDSGAESNAVEVRVRDVPIGRLLSEWRIEGVSGTGRLGGTIPVRVGPAGIAIADGRLDAAGPGVIRVDWGAARETLMDSGEQVALTVRALENFHYDALSLGVDRPPDGALSLAVGLDGANPDVLDGHPFRFNITLSGELEPILAAVREGRRITTDLLRGGLGAGR